MINIISSYIKITSKGYQFAKTFPKYDLNGNSIKGETESKNRL